MFNIIVANHETKPMQITSSPLTPSSTPYGAGVSNTSNQPTSKSQSKWGPSVIVDIKAPVSASNHGTVSYLRPEWQNVLDRLKANPKAANAVIALVLSAHSNYESQLIKTENKSSVSMSSSARRTQISKDIDKIKTELQAVAAHSNGKNTAAKIKQLINSLNALLSELKSLPSGDGGMSTMPNFDGAGIANSALDAATGKSDAPTVAADANNTLSTQDTPHIPEINQDEALTSVVHMMQDHTDRANYYKDRGISAAASNDQAQDQSNEYIKDLQKLANKLLDEAEHREQKNKLV
jgi:hypothetical protein